ncbi:MAG: TIGR00153 family protein [Candidatus Cloacimonetes bacterium]|nr:TIGR00153 family protein [Candidatus Cloacimonadota bacterium]MBL7148917.1 TIGR00153 family protein [Candidatus Cloacimonadota bacterium]
MNGLFSRSKDLQASMDGFIDRVEKAGLIFYEGLKAYFSGKKERFEEYTKELTELESKADAVRRDIKYKLYTHMLIPESRGDVLGVLETLDDVIDITEKVLEHFYIETPDIPEYLREDFKDLAELSYKSVEELAKASRAFFTELKLVNNYVNKVHFYEHEADKLEKIIKHKIFNSGTEMDLSIRMHLRYFAEKIALLSDEAESVAERLAIYAIKRRI